MDFAVVTSLSIISFAVILWFVFKHTKGFRNLYSTRSELTSKYSRSPLTKLIFSDIHQPLAEIRRFELMSTSRREILPLHQDQLDRLSAIFQHAPSLASNTLAAMSNTFILHFPPKVAQNIANGSFKVMEAAEGGLRAIAVNEQGKIVAQGTLIPVSGAKFAVAATAVWQGLALLTAQHFLSDIEQHLFKIEQGINELRAHLETQDIATLTSSLKHLQSISFLFESTDFRELDLTASIVNLDNIDRDCGRILEGYRTHMLRHTIGFKEMPLTSLFKVNFSAIQEKTIEYEKAACICLQAIYVKAVVAQFRCALPGDRRIAYARLRELATDLSGWKIGQEDFVRIFKQRMEDDTNPALHMDKLKNLFHLDGTLPDSRREQITRISLMHEAMLVLHTDLEQEITNSCTYLDQQLSSITQSLDLIVQLNEQGQIEQVSRLVNE